MSPLMIGHVSGPGPHEARRGAGGTIPAVDQMCGRRAGRPGIEWRNLAVPGVAARNKTVSPASVVRFTLFSESHGAAGDVPAFVSAAADSLET